MKFFYEKDIIKAKNDAKIEQSRTNQAQNERMNAYLQRLQPIYTASQLFCEMIREYPSLADRFGVNPEKLFLHKGRFIPQYTVPLYRLPAIYNHAWVCVDKQGELFSYKTSLSELNNDCSLNRIESLTIEDIKQVVKNYGTCYGFSSDSYATPYPIYLFAVLALCSFKCDQETDTCTTSYTIKEKYDSEQQMAKIKDYILYTLTHYVENESLYKRLK